jgi:hypothetical protein
MTIEILTSGVALGVHVPGLLLADRLREKDIPVGVSVLERLLPAQKLATTATMKFAFHRDFRVALAGQKMAGSPADSVAPAAVEALFADWRSRGVDRVVVFSGFWLPVLAGYDCAIDVCHVDSVASPSFAKTVTDLDIRHVWLADADAGTIPCSIPVSDESPVPWADREPRVFLHGGGWGMGTYRDRIGELLEHGLQLDVIAYEGRDVTADGVRYFMVDPAWHPWLDNGYPPFGEVGAGFARSVGHHGSFDLTRSAVATVSKPGGGTLLDSLWSATPAVLLEPFGAHEQRNADLWCSLGFGIPFDTWRASGFDPELLRPLHEALLKADVPDYAEELASR